MPLSSDDIKIFLRVLDKGSFSAAARSLGRVPSAVSMAIAMLEAELQLELFDRSGREPKPTPEALSLEPRARQVLSDLHGFSEHALSLHQGLEPKLTLVVAPELLSTHWNHALAKLVQRFPALPVDVRCAPQDEALDMLHGKQANLAIVFERSHIDERIVFSEIGTETLVGVVAPDHPCLGGAQGIAGPADLFATRQIVVGRRAKVQDSRFTLSHDIWYTDNHMAALSMVRAAMGWAYLPDSLVRPMIATGELAQLSSPHFTNQYQLWVDVAWLRESPLGLGAAGLVKLLRQYR